MGRMLDGPYCGTYGVRRFGHNVCSIYAERDHADLQLPTEAETTAATSLTERGGVPGSSSLPATASVAALMPNLPPRPMLAWPRPQRECM